MVMVINLIKSIKLIRRVGGHCSSNLSELKRPPVGVMRKLGDVCVPAQVSSSSLDHGSKLRAPSPKALK
ncbi:hypothetical protein TNCV_233161 [Trichonephila clavipes]|nr:hypothetical protein TNCV_233161 [Trichonephila clavipes]